MTHKQTIILQCNSYECFLCKDFLLHIPTIDEKGDYMSNFGSKGQRTTFRWLFGCTHFWQDIWTHLGQFLFLLCTQIQDDERNMPRKFEDTLSLIKVRKGRCPKTLDDFADFSVLCQLGCFTFAFCYQFLIGIFPFDCTSLSTFIIPGWRDILQVVQIVQIDLQKFRFNAPGSNLAFVSIRSCITLQDAKRPGNHIL